MPENHRHDGHPPRMMEKLHLHHDNHRHQSKRASTHANYNAVAVDEIGASTIARRKASTIARRKSTIRTGMNSRWHASEELWPAPKQVRMGTADDMEYNHEKDMTWSELFFDLIFVVTIARLGEHARQSTVSGISFENGTYFEYFWLFFMFWLQANIYGTRFAQNDAPNMVYFAMYMLGTVGMTMHLSGGLDGEAFPGFAMSIAFTTLADTWVYLRIWLTPDPTDPDEDKRVTFKGRNFAKMNLLHNMLRFVPALAAGFDLIENRRSVVQWCIFTFFSPFIIVVFMPCMIKRPPKKPAAAASTELTEEEKKKKATEEAKKELSKKVTTFQEHAEQIQNLMGKRLENPTQFKFVPGRAPDGFDTPECEADDEYVEALEAIENFTAHIEAWVKKHKNKLRKEVTDAPKDPWGNTYDDKCWNKPHCFVPGHPMAMVPIHLEHFTERFGLFVIIGLGEVVDDITSKDADEFCPDMYIVVVASFLIIFALKTLYFDSDSAHPDDHAMRRHRLTGIIYMWLHIPMMCGVAWLGSGLNLMTAISRQCGDPDGEIEEADDIAVENRRCYVCYSLALILFSLECVYLMHMHTDDKEHPLRKFKVWAQCASALVLVAVPTFFPEEVVSDATLLVSVAIVLVCLVVFSFVEARWTLQALV